MKGIGCNHCPVNQWDCDAQYRGSRCAALRAMAGADGDPKTVGDAMRTMEPERLAEFLAKTFCHRLGADEILVWLNTLASEEGI